MINYTNIRRIFSTLDLPDNTIDEDTAIEWALHAIDKVGGLVPYESGLLLLKVENHVSNKPSDIEKINQVHLIPVENVDTALKTVCESLCTASADTEEEEETCKCTVDDTIYNNESLYRIQNQTIKSNYGLYTSPGNYENTTFGVVLHTYNPLDVMVQCDDKYYPSYDCQLYYNMSPSGVMTFNFETGIVLISYEGRPVDSEGFPLIPDVPELIDAINAYIEYKWAKQQKYMGVQGADSTLQYTHRIMEVQFNKARGKLNMISSDLYKAGRRSRRYDDFLNRDGVHNIYPFLRNYR